MSSLSCARCGVEFVRPGKRGPNPKYCSERCRYNSGRTVEASCFHCGEEFSYLAKKGQAQRYCTPECRKSGYAPRSPVSYAVCEFCSHLFVARTRRAVRSCKADECQRLLRNEQARSGRDKYAAKHGRSRESLYRDPEERSDQARRRRAMMALVETEVFAARDVFEAGRWICGLCGDPIDPELKHPHRQSATLDHIVPISKGGPHTMANCQPAHYSCNASKRDRVSDVEVLPLQSAS